MSLQTLPSTARHPHALSPEDLAKLMAMGACGKRSLPPMGNAHERKPKQPKADWSMMDDWELGQDRRFHVAEGQSKEQIRNRIWMAAFKRGFSIRTETVSNYLVATRIS